MTQPILRVPLRWIFSKFGAREWWKVVSYPFKVSTTTGSEPRRQREHDVGPGGPTLLGEVGAERNTVFFGL